MLILNFNKKNVWNKKIFLIKNNSSDLKKEKNENIDTQPNYFFLDKKIIMSLSNSENPLEDYWKKRRQINKQYYEKKGNRKKIFRWYKTTRWWIWSSN